MPDRKVLRMSVDVFYIGKQRALPSVFSVGILGYEFSFITVDIHSYS